MSMRACHTRAPDFAVLILCMGFLVCSLGAVGEIGRQRAREAVCLSNVRQLSRAWLTYSQDNHGKLVAAIGWIGPRLPVPKGRSSMR